MIDDVCTLIADKGTTVDEYLNEVSDYTEKEIFCRVSGITRSEFYAAATAGLEPEWTIHISDFRDYNGERLVRYKGQLYSVIRVYRDAGSFHSRGGMSPNEVELIIGQRIGNTGKAVNG